MPLPEADDEIQALGRTLNAMLDRLEDGLQHERQFVANASHELRMPLAVLKAELEVALRERAGEAQLRSAISSAIEETDRIVKLAEDLLLLARAHDGTLPLTPEPLDVGELLAELRERFAPVVRRVGPGPRARRHRAAARRRDRCRPRPDPAGDLEPDRQQPALRRRRRDAVGADRRRAGRAACDRPTAPALARTFVDRAFDRFSRADVARGRGGVGLGLTIVRTIAQAHGGDARARDLPGGGADVWIALPQRPLSAPAVARNASIARS